MPALLDESCEIRFADPELATNTVGHQFIVVDPAPYGLDADPEAFGNFSNGVEPWEHRIIHHARRVLRPDPG